MHIQYDTYQNLYDEKKGFGKDIINDIIHNIVERVYQFCINQIEYYNKKYGINIEVHYDVLKASQALVDTLEDLTRLKEFHPVEYPNKIKCAAYLAYWWLQRQPIHYVLSETDEKTLITKATKEDISRYIHANAFWLVSYVLGQLFSQKILNCVSNEYIEQWNVEFDYMFYFYCYRATSPKSIEAMLSTAVLHPIWQVEEGVYFEE